jgi:hypothetical protein
MADPPLPPDRAWQSAAIGLVLACLLGAAFLGGELVTLPAQPSPVPSASTTAVPAARPVPPFAPEAAPAASLAPAEANTPPAQSAIERPPAPEAPAWFLVLALAGVPLLAVVALAAWRQYRRPKLVEQDEQAFADALNHWAGAASLADPSPRELKRFVNHLRFVAAADPRERDGLDGPTMVGLAVLAHAEQIGSEPDAAGTVLGALAACDSDPTNLVAQRAGGPSWDAIGAALRDLPHAGLPEFRPSRVQARRFLDLWTGITVRG